VTSRSLARNSAMKQTPAELANGMPISAAIQTAQLNRRLGPAHFGHGKWLGVTVRTDPTHDSQQHICVPLHIQQSPHLAIISLQDRMARLWCRTGKNPSTLHCAACHRQRAARLSLRHQLDSRCGRSYGIRWDGNLLFGRGETIHCGFSNIHYTSSHSRCCWSP